MEMQQLNKAAGLGARTALIGSICMLAGAAILGASGADIDLALYANDVGGYLNQAFASQNLLILNLSIWQLGVILLGAGAIMMTMIEGQRPMLVQLVRYNYGVAVPLVIVSYMAWMAVVVRMAPYASSATDAVAIMSELMGWFAVRADWLGTVLVLGIGPVLITAMGNGVWVPRWLRLWSYVALFTGILTTIAQYAGGLTSYGFLIIPVGMGWMIATSVVLFRYQARTSVAASHL